MTFGPSHVDELPPGDAWQEIESVLDDLSRLARSDVAPAELHRELLQRLVGILSAVGGIIWSRSDGGMAVECQVNLGESLANDKDELARHRRLAEHVAEGGQPRMVPAAYRDAEIANASPWQAILCPVVVEQRTIAVVETFQRPEGRSSVLEGHLRLVRTACEIAEEYHKSRTLRELNQQQSEIARLVDYVQRIHRPLELPATAAAIANEARRLIGCDRVTVLDCSRRPRVAAISGVESFDRKSGVVQAVELLARWVHHAGVPLWISEEAEDQPPQVVEAIQSLLDESHAASTGLLPLFVDEDDEQRPVGVLVVESFGAPFSSDQKNRVSLLAKASGSALANAVRYDRIPLRGAMQWVAALLGLAPGQRWSPALAVTSALALVALALWFIPADFTIEARGQLMPQRRQHVFAPSEGIVIELPRRDGDVVQQGDLLAKLHSPALDIDESELIGKQRTVQEELITAETVALRSETDGNSREPRSAITARVLQLKEELRGLESQLRIVRHQQEALAVKSPLSGLVLTWDPERHLAGRPVKRGDLLLTVADTNGPWELLLDVPDYRTGHVLAARKATERLPVSFQLGTNPGVVGRGTLASVSPATELSAESQPAVRAIVVLNDAKTTQFRPGAGVIARIHCGRRSLGYVWLHELWEAIRLRLFL